MKAYCYCYLHDDSVLFAWFLGFVKKLITQLKIGQSYQNIMTVNIQPPNFLDLILAVFGKQRAIYIPKTDKQFGVYIARRERFLRALFRPKGQPPPTGWTYMNIK
jgi:hypothetical protein